MMIATAAGSAGVCHAPSLRYRPGFAEVRADPMTVTLSLDEAHTLVARILETNGCSPRNAAVIATTVIAAERDGAGSHGLFRMPGYVATLKSGWLDGKAVPKVRDAGPGLVAV